MKTEKMYWAVQDAILGGEINPMLKSKHLSVTMESLSLLARSIEERSQKCLLLFEMLNFRERKCNNLKSSWRQYLSISIKDSTLVW